MLREPAEDRWEMEKVLHYIQEKVLSKNNVFVTLLHYLTVTTKNNIDGD